MKRKPFLDFKVLCKQNFSDVIYALGKTNSSWILSVCALPLERRYTQIHESRCFVVLQLNLKRMYLRYQRQIN